MSDIILKECEQSMDKRLKAFDNDLKKVRTGRASINLLDGIKADYYGNPTPLNQVGNISTPDARTIIISPYEKKMIGEIEKSILKADLGITPGNDGNVVRIPIPQLTEERRKDIVKSIKKMGEDVKISIRNIRKDANDRIKKIEKSKEISEDDSKKLQGDVQKIADKFVKVTDDKIASKEKEVLTI